MTLRQAVVLGGGRSSRMGSDKLALRLQGESLLARACSAALSFADHVVVAGPERVDVPDRVIFVREDPPFSGPAAGLAAALGALSPGGEVLVLAGDLAFPQSAVDHLAAESLQGDGVVLRDEEGWPQYLCGRYRHDALSRALSGEVQNVAVRRLLGRLNLAILSAPKSVTEDLDTPGQARILGAE